MVDFWGVIGSNSIRDASGIDSALERISRKLNAFTPDSLRQFSEQLREALFRIDKREFAEIPVTLPNGFEGAQTSDHFLYARCACVLAGKQSYDEVLELGIGFESFVAPFAQEAEGLLYIASDIYESKTGNRMGSQGSFPIESMSNVQGWPD